MPIFEDLEAEQERLRGILDGLDEAQWTSPSGAPGWTVADVVLHLAQSEEAAIACVAGAFCRVAAQRLPVGESGLHAQGPYAGSALRVLRTYAA
jgi:uncharacterized protein (TIGR03083 family)